jgi:hypothetical protein
MVYPYDAWHQAICVIEDCVICSIFVFLNDLNDTQRIVSVLRNLVECYQLA